MDTKEYMETKEYCIKIFGGMIINWAQLDPRVELFGQVSGGYIHSNYKAHPGYFIKIYRYGK